jgi:phosphate transport system substrate-binding protein
MRSGYTVKMRKWLTIGAVTALAVGTIALAGCGSTTTDATGNTTEPATPAKAELSGTLTVAGSDTLVNVAQAWAKAFMAENPGVQIAVKGGGSGTGIASLINAQVDFANSSREMKAEEKDQLKAKGGEAVETKVARDGIAVIANSANAVENLTQDQLGKIYRGEVTNWKQVGGADKPIVLVSRDPSSGTYEYFKEAVVGKDKNYAKSAKLLPSNQAIVDEVKANADAIGYVGVGYESADVKVVGLDGVKASVDTVLDGSYGLSRGLYMYSNGQPKDLAKAYIDWILSEAGQKIVTGEGFVPVK